MSPQDFSKIRCKNPLKTISSPIGAMITTVKKTNRSEKMLSEKEENQDLERLLAMGR